MEMGINTNQAIALTNQAIQGAQGMALQSRGINRQIKGQKEIMKTQAKWAKELSDYQQAQQLETWKATSYPGQMEQLKKAGLNPGLMYGMGGGGGVTTGASMQTGVSGGNINTEIPTFGLQLQQQQAQIELTKAQTNAVNVDTAKKAGVDTQKVQAEITNLTANAENTKEQTALNKLQQQYQTLENKLKTDSYDKALARIQWEADDAFEQLQNDRRTNDLGEKTFNLSYDTMYQNYLKLIAETAYTKQKTGESKATTSAISTEERMNIKRSIEGLQQRWQEISNQGAKDINKLKDTNEYNILEGILGTAGTMALMEMLKKSPQTIKGFKILK